MSAFTAPNWKEALISVYAKAATDPTYRLLCLTDPVAAVAAVSDIEIPADVTIKFYDNRESYVYTFLLPPPQQTLPAAADDMIRWATVCTDLTTHGPAA